MNNKQNISDWLERLQQESWNLELLISGFSIFLLAQGQAQLDQVKEYVQLHFYLENQMQGIFFTFWGILKLSCYALIVSLVFHILMRGFWIGTIGLRSVQPAVDFKRLRYAPLFEQRLKKKLFSLDRLLIRVDQVSSAVFSFAFLMIFMLISLFCWFLSLSLFITVINAIAEPFDFDNLLSKIFRITALIIIILYVLMSLLYAIDTLFVGVIKKLKRISKVYKWVYIIVGTITLSFLYRSIYYHLVSYIGVWPSRALFNFFIFGMILLPFFKYEHEIFYPDENPDNETYSNSYDDMRTEEDLIWDASIPSATIATNNLPLFIRYNVRSNESLLQICDYEPSKKRGIISGILFKDGLSMDDPSVEEAAPDSLLQCLSSLYTVKIDDSLYQDAAYYYLTHPNREEKGIYTALDIRHLDFGYHLLSIDHKVWQEKKDTLVLEKLAVIPFWKE